MPRKKILPPRLITEPTILLTHQSATTSIFVLHWRGPGIILRTTTLGGTLHDHEYDAHSPSLWAWIGWLMQVANSCLNNAAILALIPSSLRTQLEPQYRETSTRA